LDNGESAETPGSFLKTSGEEELTSFHQIRMRFGSGGEDLASPIWKTGHIGIWFGGWIPDEFALSHTLLPTERLKYFDGINDEKGVKWHFKSGDLWPVQRFFDLTPGNWVYTCFEDRIHLGHVSGPVERGDELFDRDGETFKSRTISGVKDFLLSELPDPYRLVPAGARGTLFQIHAYDPMMRILGASASELEVSDRAAALEWDQWLDFLGPQGWESLCLGFLIFEHDFVPTGLVIGGTLKDFDIIGANRTSAERIYGQCKKDRYPRLEPPSEFLAAAKDLLGCAKVFFLQTADAGIVPLE